MSQPPVFASRPGNIAVFSADTTSTIQDENSLAPIRVDNKGNVLVTGSMTVSGIVFPGSMTVTGTVGVSNFPTVQTITGSVGVNGITFPESVTVTGSVGVTNFPATQTVTGSVGLSAPVSISNFPATQTVTGTVALSPALVTTPSGSLATAFAASFFNLTPTALTGSGDSNPVNTSTFAACSITAEIAGNLSGTLSIQVANTQNTPSSTQWSTVTQPNTSAVVVSGSASSPVTWVLPRGSRFARVDYVSAISGSGSITAYGNGQGV